jgi:hypothetical protein
MPGSTYVVVRPAGVTKSQAEKSQVDECDADLPSA